MPTISTEKILDSLKSTMVPSEGKSVVDLGIVSGIIIKEGNVGFSLEIEATQAKEMESVRQNCEKQVRTIPGVLSVTAVLTSERAKPSGDKTKDKFTKPADNKEKTASGNKEQSSNKEKETKKK